MKNIIIWTIDSDILTIVLEQFELITQKYDNLNVCVRFGKAKDYIAKCLSVRLQTKWL